MTKEQQREVDEVVASAMAKPINAEDLVAPNSKAALAQLELRNSLAKAVENQ